MKKLVQLVFGDWRNSCAVASALALAWLASRASPQFGGWTLVPALLLAAWWQASR